MGGIEMYAIIFWEDDDTVKPLLNNDGTLTLFDDIDDADVTADRFEKEHEGWETRVISIEGVKE